MVQGGGQRVIPSPGGLAGWKRKRHACPSAFRAVFQVRSLNSLTSLASRRTYEYAIEEFIAWHCSEPRLAFNRIVVTRYPHTTGSAGPGGGHHQPKASGCPTVGVRSVGLQTVEC